jgi:hypothetical protein
VKKEKRKKIKKLVLHVGFWSAVSGVILINSLYNGIFREKINNDNFKE